MYQYDWYLYRRKKRPFKRQTDRQTHSHIQVTTEADCSDVAESQWTPILMVTTRHWEEVRKGSTENLRESIQALLTH